MGLARGFLREGGMTREAGPGDIPAAGEKIGALTTVGAGTWTAALIAGGIIRRTGPVGGYTDTTATAHQILVALAGNQYSANIMPGTTFRLLFINGVAQAMTLAAGRGVTLGTNVDGSASLVREYLLTVLCAQAEVTKNCGTTNGNKIITFDEPQNPGTVVPGMVVSGTGITAGTKVVGLTYGDTTNRDDMDKITGCTTDTNSTATNASGIALTFSPNIEIAGLREGTA